MTGPTYADILELAHGLQQDLRNANAKLTTIRSWLAAQPEHERNYEHVCSHPGCGYAFSTERRLAIHIANVHDGPPVPLDPAELTA
jgi:hypothetical protein